MNPEGSASVPLARGMLSPDEVPSESYASGWWRSMASPGQQAAELDRTLAAARERYAEDLITLEEFEAVAGRVVREQDVLARRLEREAFSS